MAPGFLSEYSDVTTVYFDDKQKWWAKVRKYPARRDFKAAQAVLISPEMRYVGEGEAATADTRGKIDTGAYQDELVARALVEWNLTDETGSPIPLGVVNPATGIPDDTRRAAVARLPEAVFEEILKAIEGATKKKTAPTETPADAAFRGPGVAGAAGAELPAAAGTGAVPA